MRNSIAHVDLSLILTSGLPGSGKSTPCNLHGIPEVTWDRVEARRKVYTVWKEPTLKLDTHAQDLQTNTAIAVKYIESA